MTYNFFMVSTCFPGDCSLSTEELLDEDNHFVLLNGTRSVLVEGGEDLIESLIRELISGSEVTEGVLNELLGLFLVECAGLIDVVSVPDLVDDALNCLFLRGCH